MNRNELQDHIFSTYITLRLGLAIICAAFPIVVYAAGLLDGVGLQDSLSAYYWATGTGRNLPRIFFVGLLFALATSLYLYKGFTVRENVALNAAAILGIGVAAFPMEWNCGTACGKFSLHGFCAVTLFLCLAYVVFFRALDTLPFLPPGREDLAARYKARYRTIGIVMALSPISAFLVNVLVGSDASFIFFLESAGILAFAWFWWIKGQELKLSGATRRALRAEIDVTPT